MDSWRHAIFRRTHIPHKKSYKCKLWDTCIYIYSHTHTSMNLLVEIDGWTSLNSEIFWDILKLMSRVFFFNWPGWTSRVRWFFLVPSRHGLSHGGMGGWGRKTGVAFLPKTWSLSEPRSTSSWMARYALALVEATAVPWVMRYRIPWLADLWSMVKSLDPGTVDLFDDLWAFQTVNHPKSEHLTIHLCRCLAQWPPWAHGAAFKSCPWKSVDFQGSGPRFSTGTLVSGFDHSSAPNSEGDLFFAALGSRDWGRADDQRSRAEDPATADAKTTACCNTPYLNNHTWKRA